MAAAGLALLLATVLAGLAGWPAEVGAKELPSPIRAALLPSGRLLVTDAMRPAVLEWDPRRDEVVRVIEVPGRPMGIAYGWGKLFVGNKDTEAVEVYTAGGKLLYLLGGARGLVANPTDIALDRERGLVFVSDANGAKVLVFDRQGSLLRTLPHPDEPNRLAAPTGVAVDPLRGEVLVSDYGAGSFTRRTVVRIYDYEGRHRGDLIGHTTGAYGFSRPQGLAVLESGRIFVVDSLRCQVLVFDRASLQGIAVLSEPGRAPGQLLLPMDIAIDERDGTIFVTDNHNSRIAMFAGGGLVP